MASKAAELTIRDAVEILARGYRVDARGRPTRHVRGTDPRAFADLHAREVYSYGRHFPLLRFVPKSGRQPALFVLNGDQWRGGFSATSSHQEIARAAVAASGVRSIILPFSALAGAGIDIDTVRPVHVREDRTWHELRELPADAPDLDALETADERCERDESPDGPNAHATRPAGTHSVMFTWRRPSGVYTRTLYRRAHSYDPDAVSAWHAAPAHVRGPYPAGSWRELPRESDWLASPVSEHVYRDGNTELQRCDDDRWYSRHWRHQLGDALFSAVRVDIVERRPDAGEHTPAVDGRACSSSDSLHAADLDGRTCAHCGARLTLVRESRRYRARFLSSFDYQESPPLYFLAQVPRGAGETVESALDALAPCAVHAAIARGREVLRQGDVFAIATELTDAEVYGRARARARLTQWTRDARARAGEVGYRPPLTAAQRGAFAAYRRRLWRETWREAVRAATAHERPRAVPYGRGVDRDSHRRLYGTNALAAWHRADADARAHYAPALTAADREHIRATLAVYTTSHTATEVVRARNGAVYVRGIMRHVPELEPGRRGGRDHRPLTLGDGRQWFLAVRNTVPRQSRRPRWRRSTAGAVPAER